MLHLCESIIVIGNGSRRGCEFGGASCAKGKL